MLGLLLEQPYLKHKLNNQFVRLLETHYHYNTVMVPKTTIESTSQYQLHDLNVKTTPEKNWVNGIQSVNNKVGINDDVVTTKS